MQRFPLTAKIYIWAVIAAGVPTFWMAYRLHPHLPPPHLLLLWCGVSAVATLYKVRLFGIPNQSNSQMSLGFVPTFFALMCFGPPAGMIVATVSCTADSLYPRRAHYYQILFSISAVALSVLAAGAVLQGARLAPGEPGGGGWLTPETVSGIFVATLSYYLINTLAVAAAIALSSGGSPLQIWREHFLWTGPGYFTGASCATIIYGLHRADGLGLAQQGTLIVAVAIPILYLTYSSFKIYMEKVQASERHIRELEQGKEEMQRLYLSTVESLALAIDAKDRYTREHILRVQKVTVAIAEEMGLSGEELQGIRTGALLHDIGKLGIPEHILGKPGKLTDEEFEKIKEHPAIGAMILKPVSFPWPVTESVRSHHERWDGSGYPDGLKGAEIPIGGRILAVADVYDALTSDRSYRGGWPHRKACDHIKAGAGTHFDPAIVPVFLKVMERNPALRNDTEEKTLCFAAPKRGGAADGFSRINRASFEYISLYEISQTVSVTLNLQETLSLLAHKINNIFGATTCVLLLADGEALEAEMAVGLNEPFFRGARACLGEGVTGTVAAHGKGLAGEYDRSDLLLASVPVAWEPLQSALIAPLFAEGQVIGTVNLYHDRPEAFGAEDLRVLLAVSAQAGRAIRNARVFERTRESALTDPLTGLHNARYLSLFLEQELHRGGEFGQRPLSVLVMDLDNFKPINDTFGHARGDEVLRDLGAVFQGTLRGGDLIARYAGDEFVAVLPGTGSAEAGIVAEKVRAAIGAYDPRVSGNDLAGIRVGISVGTASFPQDAGDAATLIAVADAAMYRDKSRRKRSWAADAGAPEGQGPLLQLAGSA